MCTVHRSSCYLKDVGSKHERIHCSSFLLKQNQPRSICAAVSSIFYRGFAGEEKFLDLLSMTHLLQSWGHDGWRWRSAEKKHSSSSCECTGPTPSMLIPCCHGFFSPVWADLESFSLSYLPQPFYFPSSCNHVIAWSGASVKSTSRDLVMKPPTVFCFFKILMSLCIPNGFGVALCRGVSLFMCSFMCVCVLLFFSEIAASFAKAVHFNTFGGNPVACAIASSVLDVRVHPLCAWFCM